MVSAMIPRSGRMLAVVVVGLFWAISGFPQSAGEGAAKSLREKAERGDAAAQFNLGLKHYTGQGVQQDYAEAIRWFRKAADQGETSAQFNLGVMYANGRGVSQDYTEAIRWFRKAADQGEATAQFILGAMYADGQGVPQDYVLAHKWLSLGAAQATKNSEKFAQARDAVSAKMTADQIAEAQRLAREWKPKPTEK